MITQVVHMHCVVLQRPRNPRRVYSFKGPVPKDTRDQLQSADNPPGKGSRNKIRATSFTWPWPILKVSNPHIVTRPYMRRDATIFEVCPAGGRVHSDTCQESCRIGPDV